MYVKNVKYMSIISTISNIYHKCKLYVKCMQLKYILSWGLPNMSTTEILQQTFISNNVYIFNIFKNIFYIWIHENTQYSEILKTQNTLIIFFACINYLICNIY